MTIEEIKELIQVVKDSGVAELEVQRGENKVWIKRTAGLVQQEVVLPSPAPAVFSPPASSPSPAAAPQPAPASPQPADATADPTLQLVRSPIVGTFYEAPAPGKPPFVRIGEVVHPGQVLCIVESMKLMNEIESEIAGTIVSKLVENGRPVEYGEAMFAVRPL